MLPSDVIACDTACAAFDASVVGYVDLLFLPLVYIRWAYTDATEIKWAFYAHVLIFDPEMRIFVYLVAISVEFVVDGHWSFGAHENILHMWYASLRSPSLDLRLKSIDLASLILSCFVSSPTRCHM